MKNEISLGEIKKSVIHTLYRRVFENVCHTSYSKNCLLIYVATAYLKIPIVSKFIQNPTHQNIWQTHEIAHIMSTLGYNVDVADYSVEGIKLHKKYDAVIDIHPKENAIYKEHLKEGGKKIAFITGPNPAFSNAQEERRLQNLFKRTGRMLRPRRHISPMPASLALFDAMLFVGNAHNLRQYDAFPIPHKYCVPNYGYSSLKPETNKEKDPNAFLFLGSSGMVFRGLDLLLEVFSRLPNQHLYICASLDDEKDFVKIYEKELFHTPNIHVIGFIGLASQEYRELCNRCSYMILPSCAEGMSGSVLVAMSAGVIPLVIRECGVDYLHYFTDTSIPGLTKTVQTSSKKPISWIRAESKRMVSIIEKHYTQQQFSLEVKRALKKVVAS